MKKLKQCCFIAVLMIFCGSCSNKNIEISTDYIINGNWTKDNEQVLANTITINLMKVKRDSLLNAFENPDHIQILNKLEEDSSFMRYANVKIGDNENYGTKKIYFTKKNDFLWGSKLHQQEDDTIKVIGELQKKSWYKFSHLVSNPFFVYLYVDSLKQIHRFDVNLSNY